MNTKQSKATKTIGFLAVVAVAMYSLIVLAIKAIFELLSELPEDTGDNNQFVRSHETTLDEININGREITPLDEMFDDPAEFDF